jgi:hypothetical protein
VRRLYGIGELVNGIGESSRVMGGAEKAGTRASVLKGCWHTSEEEG